MRGVIIAVLSALVTSLMLTPSLAAASSSVFLKDSKGDLAIGLYDSVDGTPVALWPSNSPVGKAGYLDISLGSITVDDAKVTAEMEVWYPMTEDSQLPHGVRAVWWEWRFYENTGYLYADYVIVIQWDGEEFKAYVSSGEAALSPFCDDIIGDVDGCTATAVVDGEYGLLIQGANYWLFETRVWFMPPPIPPDYIVDGGWFAVDTPDLPWNYLPYLDMPTDL